jgi:predicted methyltransferase
MATMISRRLAIGLAVLALAGAASPALADDALKAAIADPARTPANAARDGARHPYESLTFWGLAPGQVVVEVQPGGGYWTEILAPYAKATGGRYVATAADLKDPNLPERARTGREAFAARFADASKYGKVELVDWGQVSTTLGAPASADVVLTARNIHNWMWTPGQLDKNMAAFFAVLKPGGVLAIEEHRADPRPQKAEARDGYVSTATVIAAAEKAGFRLDAQSEVNANPKDTKDHPFGVWTLQPTRSKSGPEERASPGADRSAPFDPTKYEAMGESDRMTLRFRKP